MSQKYYEYSHYKEQDEQGPQQRPPRGSHAPYLLVFQAIFYSFFHVSTSRRTGGVCDDVPGPELIRGSPLHIFSTP